MRRGILGGAFNPPHIGHLVCAQEARVRLGLERVTLVPVGEAPHRSLEQDPGPEVRFEMCQLAVSGDEGLEVSRAEIDRDGPSYTADTLRELASGGDELYFVLGADQARSLPEWERPEEVVSLAALAIAEREEAGRDEVMAALRDLPGAERAEFFAMPRIDVSSSLVRARAAAGEPLRYLVPEPVARLIAEQELYG